MVPQYVNSERQLPRIQSKQHPNESTLNTVCEKQQKAIENFMDLVLKQEDMQIRQQINSKMKNEGKECSIDLTRVTNNAEKYLYWLKQPPQVTLDDFSPSLHEGDRVEELKTNLNYDLEIKVRHTFRSISTCRRTKMPTPNEQKLHIGEHCNAGRFSNKCYERQNVADFKFVKKYMWRKISQAQFDNGDKITNPNIKSKLEKWRFGSDVEVERNEGEDYTLLSVIKTENEFYQCIPKYEIVKNVEGKDQTMTCDSHWLLDTGVPFVAMTRSEEKPKTLVCRPAESKIEKGEKCLIISAKFHKIIEDSGIKDLKPFNGHYYVYDPKKQEQVKGRKEIKHEEVETVRFLSPSVEVIIEIQNTKLPEHDRDPPKDVIKERNGEHLIFTIPKIDLVPDKIFEISEFLDIKASKMNERMKIRFEKKVEWVYVRKDFLKTDYETSKEYFHSCPEILIMNSIRGSPAAVQEFQESSNKILSNMGKIVASSGLIGIFTVVLAFPSLLPPSIGYPVHNNLKTLLSSFVGSSGDMYAARMSETLDPDDDTFNERVLQIVEDHAHKHLFGLWTSYDFSDLKESPKSSPSEKLTHENQAELPSEKGSGGASFNIDFEGIRTKIGDFVEMVRHTSLSDVWEFLQEFFTNLMQIVAELLTNPIGLLFLLYKIKKAGKLMTLKTDKVFRDAILTWKKTNIGVICKQIYKLESKQLSDFDKFKKEVNESFPTYDLKKACYLHSEVGCKECKEKMDLQLSTRIVLLMQTMNDMRN